MKLPEKIELPVDATLIVLADHAPDTLAEGLTALATAGDPVHTEIVVLDNGRLPAGVTGDLERRHPEMVFFENHPPEPLSRAVNRCLAVGRGRYFGLLPAGVSLTATELCDLVLFLDTNPEIGMVGLASPAGMDMDRLPSPSRLLGKFSGLALLFGERRQSRPPVSTAEVAWLPLTPTFYRREMLAETGLFHEGFEAFYHDIDLCRRARRLGWHLVLRPVAGIAPPPTTPAILDPPPPGAPLAGPSPVQLLDACRYLGRRLLGGRVRTSFSVPESGI